jgi:peroxiredoxin Q/BCP
MAQLRQDHQKFLAEDTKILVVGPENAAAFSKYWEKNNLPYTGLPDPKHTVLKLYGQQIKLFKLGRMPAQVIIDKTGTARFVHYGNAMSDIPSNKEVLSILHGINNDSIDESSLNSHEHSALISEE